MKKLLFLFSIIFCLALGNESYAQYTTGVGLRAGVSNGLTVKHFISQDAALEGILHTRWGGFVITGLYEVHKDISDVKGLMWFFGGGAHVGTWNARRSNRPWGDNRVATTVVGLDGIIGLDYVFDNAPINLSLDWKPVINFGGSGFWGDEVALSIRYAF
ncbi:hypothetical protein [Mongoliibacter ruber]|uniref:Outer membrane protein n=1 Tax=Mongoliibacter ruber TaxID=1750599 RepID=A0A2T0WII4_9BACT|nr:hypothetical protein [Mongoliibacter ruber]PRY86344.1 hypothetical protein CLW00_109192 [Mongoliibacter ruber]